VSVADFAYERKGGEGGQKANNMNLRQLAEIARHWSRFFRLRMAISVAAKATSKILVGSG
jgi:hypothetical protein